MTPFHVVWKELTKESTNGYKAIDLPINRLYTGTYIHAYVRNAYIHTHSIHAHACVVLFLQFSLFEFMVRISEIIWTM